MNEIVQYIKSQLNSKDKNIRYYILDDIMHVAVVIKNKSNDMDELINYILRDMDESSKRSERYLALEELYWKCRLIQNKGLKE